MNRPTSTSLRPVLALALLCAPACQRDADHDHDHGDSHADHHDHAAEHAAAPEPPTLDVTVYESGLELFMEYPSFVVGADSPLVAHFTDARDPEGQKGIGVGQVTATLTFADGTNERFIADAPQRLGVFKPVVKPTRAGKATLTLQLEGAQASGTVHVGDVVVYATIKDAIAADAPEVAGAEKTFPYFKEAMWKTVYATAPAEKRVLRGGIAATGDIVPKATVSKQVTLPEGMFIVYGGQFESARDAARTIGGLSLLAIIAVFSLLAMAYRSGRNAVLTLVNLPLALIGGVFAVAVTSGSISTPALVGFVTLFGIATRNGILLVSHYEHLMQEGCDLATAVRRGSAERLTPVLMTALCAGLALLPLVMAGNEAGNEIQAPMGVVILGGLLSATALNMFVLPALFLRFGIARRGSPPSPA
jgi:hypothetical protein